MEPESAVAQEVSVQQNPHPRFNWKRLSLWGGVATLCFSVGLSIYSALVVHIMGARIDDENLSQTVSDFNQNNDLLSPDIGVIQFMHRGYSVTFDSLTYGQNGLEVTGTVGNATNVTLSSVTLKLSARPFLYKLKEKIMKSPFYLYGNDYEIGSGQANIGFLFPGKTAVFSMTIPNVKQSPDGFQIAASFTGERYSF